MSALLICTLTQQKVNPARVQSKLPAQYASDWFQSHKGQKPTIHICSTKLTVDQLQDVIERSFGENKLDMEAVKCYLAKKAPKFKANLSEDWVSYGVTIGTSGNDVSVGSLITIVETEKDLAPFDVGEKRPSSDDHDVIMCLLFIHRLGRLSENADTDNYVKNLKLTMKRKDSHMYSNVSKVTAYKGYGGDKDFNKLVAAYDMFFFRFSDH